MEIAPNDIPIYAYILKLDLLKFTRFFFFMLNEEKFVMNWHHEVLFKGLTSVYDRETDILIENLPPRHSKTELIIMFIAWSLANNPASSFLVISSDDTLANELSRRVRDIILHPVYFSMFGVDLKMDVNSKGLWRTTKGGGIRSVPIGGGITGFGAGHINDFDKFYGAIILDDPDKIANLNTANERQASERFDDTIVSRRNGTNTPIIIIQQRISVNDLTAHILSGKSKLGDVSKLRFLHVCIPVIIDGKPIWEKRFNLEQIEAARSDSDSSFIFDAQWMQNPSSKEGSIFQDVKLYEPDFIEKDKIIHRVIAVDTADEGADYFAAIFGVLIDKSIYIEDVIYNQALLSVNKDILMAFVNKHNPDVLAIETNREGTAFIGYFAELKEKGIKLLPYKSTVNKLIRILNEEIHIKENFYFRKDAGISFEYKKFLTAFKGFNSNMKNKNDDAPDVTAALSQYFRVYKRKL